MARFEPIGTNKNIDPNPYLLSPPSMGQIAPLMSFYKDGFGIK